MNTKSHERRLCVRKTRKFSSPAYFPPSPHILSQPPPRCDRRDTRMAIHILTILCTAVVLVMLACLWVNR